MVYEAILNVSSRLFALASYESMPFVLASQMLPWKKKCRW